MEKMNLKAYLLLFITYNYLWAIDPLQFLSNINQDAIGKSKEQCTLMLSEISLEDLFLRNNIDQIDLDKFSHLTMSDGYHSLLGFDAQSYREAVHNGSITTLLEQRKELGIVIEPWGYSLSPDYEVRKFGFHNDKMLPSDIQSNQEKLEYLERTKDKFDQERVQNVSEQMNRILAQRINDNHSNINQTSMQVTAICAMYGPLLALKCSKSLKNIVKDMTPFKLQNLSFPLMNAPLWEEIFKDIDYYRATNKVATKLVKYLSTEIPEGANLFDDILESFIESGVESTQAYEKTWNLLGFYSARGANIGESVKNVAGIAGRDFANSLQIMATAITLIDSKIATTKPSYTLPSNVSTAIDNGKPYHFWMTAYLARKQTRLTGSKKAAKVAAYLSNLGYQMKSTSPGRDPNRAFMIDPLAPANNKIRFDLLYAGAGAKFGSESINQLYNGLINMDQILIKMIKKSKLLKPISKDKAKAKWSGTGIDGYLRWKSIFKPDLVLEM